LDLKKCVQSVNKNDSPKRFTIINLAECLSFDTLLQEVGYMSDSKENVDVLKMYGEDSTTQRDEFLKKHNLNEKGLTSKQAEINIKKFGLNETKKAKPKKWYNFLLQSLLTPFNCILIGISAILIYTDIYLAIEPSYANIIVIAILVTASTLLDFFESYRSNKAAEKLREIVETTTTVIRDNKEINIPVKNVTLGDIVLLSAGSIIPADLRIIESKDLYVGQASLTGESDNIKKTVELENNQEELDSISDFDNICFMGTNVVSGSAKGVVIKIGDSTYFGEIANTVTSGKEKTAFQKGIESISKLLIRIMIFMIPIVFLINVEKHDIILAFTFAVAIAICITPLLLPVILSSSLSKGAVRMSKKKTIVKKLDSIQNFGAMNIFCTDKTGTLTEDKIVLEKYLNVNGEEDFNILKYAFLNAYLQTGLKSNIDEAVVAKAKTVGIENSVEKYKKIDEIPFDFSRRCLSIAVEIDNKDELITKGAVEEILNICTTFEYKGQTEKLTNEKIENMKRICKNLNEEGFRVVAICKKIITNNKKDFNSTDEKDMTLLGFIGFLDPPKESAKEAIESLNNAGIRVLVLTGDNVEVTRCVCNKAGINSKEIITGNKIDALSDVALSRLLKRNNIFAKLSPIQKARIVRVLKQNGNVVGYMGDGINDSPALTNSDVGISVDTAVDIAKETADIILLEKDLNVLLDGVMERKKNICKFNEIYKNGNKFQLWGSSFSNYCKHCTTIFT
jgi:Mg2+-importing ATPase